MCATGLAHVIQRLFPHDVHRGAGCAHPRSCLPVRSAPFVDQGNPKNACPAVEGKAEEWLSAFRTARDQLHTWLQGFTHCASTDIVMSRARPMNIAMRPNSVLSRLCSLRSRASFFLSPVCVGLLSGIPQLTTGMPGVKEPDFAGLPADRPRKVSLVLGTMEGRSLIRQYGDRRRR